MDHENYIRRALELAKSGSGKVSPNPKVGAVIVKDGRVLSEGVHKAFGQPHAEIEAIHNTSPEALKNACLYVNLEPCSHHGKTPPCTEAIIGTGIRTVIYGMKDPNPLVSGRGIKRLRQAGIEVIGPVLKDECLSLNEGFVKAVLYRIPWITVKIAQTLDGKIALSDGHSKWITCQASRRLVHQWRAEHDAVLVGIQTVLQDDPMLNVRMTQGRSPKRIVLDTHLRIPVNARVVSESPVNTIILTSESADRDKKKTLKDFGVSVLETETDQNRIQLASVWQTLIEKGICSILVEGGQQVFTYFFERKTIDRLCIFIAPKIFGCGKNAVDDFNSADFQRDLPFTDFEWTSVGDDMLFKGTRTCLQV